MPLAGIVTLVAVALTVAALALYLIHVIVLLRATSFTLGTIIAGLRAIAYQTAPLGPVLTEINEDLAETQAALEEVLGVELSGDEPLPTNVEPIQA